MVHSAAYRVYVAIDTKLKDPTLLESDEEITRQARYISALSLYTEVRKRNGPMPLGLWPYGNTGHNPDGSIKSIGCSKNIRNMASVYFFLPNLLLREAAQVVELAFNQTNMIGSNADWRLHCNVPLETPAAF